MFLGNGDWLYVGDARSLLPDGRGNVLRLSVGVCGRVIVMSITKDSGIWFSSIGATTVFWL